MSHMHPSHYYPELTDDRLKILAERLLDIRYSTIQSMNTEYDDNYTRETAVFGRTRQMLISLALSKKYDWLELKSPAMDVTISIGSVPVRYFCDNPLNPEKAGYFRRNEVDQLIAIDEQQPIMWRIIVEKALTNEDEDHVFFVGHNAYQEKISEWVYRPSTPTLHSIGQETPLSKSIASAPVDLPDDVAKKQNDDKKTGTAE